MNELGPLVVYDVDDILWPLSATVAKMCGVEPERMIELDTPQNEMLSPEEREAVIKMYHSPKPFLEAEFFPGAERILEVQRLGARVLIISNSFSDEIAAVKCRRLFQKVRGLRPEQLILKVNTPETTTQKMLPEDTLVALEDSPYNIANSPAKVNIVPFAYWNMTAKAVGLMREKNMLRTIFGDLPRMMELVEQVVRHELDV